MGGKHGHVEPDRVHLKKVNERGQGAQQTIKPSISERPHAHHCNNHPCTHLDRGPVLDGALEDNGLARDYQVHKLYRRRHPVKLAARLDLMPKNITLNVSTGCACQRATFGAHAALAIKIR